MNRHASPRGAKLCVCLVAFLLLGPTARAGRARAQDLDDVTFSGTVKDQHGAVVVGASVSAVNAATGAARSVFTDTEGRYCLVELAPGAYTLRVEAVGFTTEERREVSTLAGQHVRLDFALGAAGPAEESLTVSATETPTLNTTRVVAGGAVAREELERLPSWSRSALDFVFTLGGVAEEPLPRLYSEILYAYETAANVYAGSCRVQTKKLYVHVPFTLSAVLSLSND
jgi:Carboxypeptidase regulatory-like domain